MAKRRRTKRKGGLINPNTQKWLIIGGVGVLAFFLFKSRANAQIYTPSSGGSTGGSTGGGTTGGSTGGGTTGGGTLTTGQYLGANTYKSMFDAKNTNYNYDVLLSRNSTNYYEVYILQVILNRNKPVMMMPDLVLDGLFGNNTETALRDLTGKTSVKLSEMFLIYGNPVKNNLNIL